MGEDWWRRDKVPPMWSGLNTAPRTISAKINVPPRVFPAHIERLCFTNPCIFVFSCHHSLEKQTTHSHFTYILSRNPYSEHLFLKLQPPPHSNISTPPSVLLNFIAISNLISDLVVVVVGAQSRWVVPTLDWVL